MKILIIHMVGLAMLLFAEPAFAGEVNCSADSGNVETCARVSQTQAQPSSSQYQTQAQHSSQSQSQSVVNNIYTQAPQQYPAGQQAKAESPSAQKGSFLTRVGQLLLLKGILNIPVSAALGV
jgi:hypothetical protein